MLFGVNDTLLNSTDDLGCLADAYADLSLAVADNDDRSEAQLLSTFDHFGHPAHLNNLLFPITFDSLTRVFPPAAVGFATRGTTPTALAFATTTLFATGSLFFFIHRKRYLLVRFHLLAGEDYPRPHTRISIPPRGLPLPLRQFGRGRCCHHD